MDFYLSTAFFYAYFQGGDPLFLEQLILCCYWHHLFALRFLPSLFPKQVLSNSLLFYHYFCFNYTKNWRYFFNFHAQSVSKCLYHFVLFFLKMIVCLICLIEQLLTLQCYRNFGGYHDTNENLKNGLLFMFEAKCLC